MLIRIVRTNGQLIYIYLQKYKNSWPLFYWND